MPFCKACRAPQIRVPGFEPSQSVVLPEIHGAAEHESALPPPLTTPAQSSRIQWAQALPCAAIGGVFSLLLIMVFAPGMAGLAGSSIGAFALGAAFMVGGAWSARLYYRKAKDAPVRPGTGAQVGAAAGGFGFLFFAVVVVAIFVYLPDEFRKPLADAGAPLANRGYDPEKVRQFVELLKTREGLVFFVSFGLFVTALIFVIGASIGGAWYGAWLRKRTRN
ncbi:MAG TPA: hypothetical protein VNY29_05885 [Terriglobales bacterium]|nr:hypothetical protein [Terriglobales bacterium]